MPGGLLQLNAYGAQNQYLNGNPQMTFFKVVYRRYTNFSSEYIRQNVKGPNQLSPNVPIQLTCKIDRNGDLIQQIYFSFNLPDIYSAYDWDTAQGLLKAQEDPIKSLYNLNLFGNFLAKSATLLSKNGALHSNEFIMLARSTFTRILSVKYSFV